MTLYLKLTSNDPDATPLVIVNGSTDTGYYVTEGDSLGSPAYNVSHGGGNAFHAVPTSATPTLRTYALTVMVKGSSQSVLNTRLRALYEALEAVNLSGGGRLKIGTASLTNTVDLDVVSVTATGDAWSKLAHTANAHAVPLQFVCRPYTLASPSDISDGFGADTFTTSGAGYNVSGVDWTAVTGTFASSPISGGVVTAASALTTERLFTHTGTGNTYNHARVGIKATVGTTLTSFKAGVIIKYVDASNYLEAYMDDTGAASRLRIDVVIAGVRTNISSTAATRLTVSTPIYVWGWLDGGMVNAAYWLNPAFPPSLSTGFPAATNTGSIALTSAQMTALGDTIAGNVGVVWTPQQASATLDDFNVGFSYRRAASLPETFNLRNIGGDARALGTFRYASPGSTTVQSAQIAWWKKPRPYNMVHNPGAEPDINGYSGTAVTSLNAAATVSRTTTAAEIMEGTAAVKVVTTGVALNEGVNYRTWDRCKAGITYTVDAYVKVISGGITTIRFGAHCAGVVTSVNTATVNSSTWTRVTHSFIMPANATGTALYIGFTTNATVAATFALDRVQLYEGTTAPAYPTGGNLPVGSIHALNAVAPTGWTETNDATNYRLAYGQQVAGSLAAASTLSFPLVTYPLNMDWANETEAQFTVYGSFRLASTQVSPTVTVSVTTLYGSSGTRYTHEYGSSGKVLAIPSAGTCNRYAKLGTISLPTNRTHNMQYNLNVACTNDPASTGTFGIDHIWLVPASCTASTMTGVPNDSTSAPFISGTNSTVKTVAFDRTATAARAGYESVGVPDAGLGGADIQLPSGDVEAFVFASSTILDQTGSAADSATKPVTGAFGFDVQPRHWGFSS